MTRHVQHVIECDGPPAIIGYPDACPSDTPPIVTQTRDEGEDLARLDGWALGMVHDTHAPTDACPDCAVAGRRMWPELCDQEPAR